MGGDCIRPELFRDSKEIEVGGAWLRIKTKSILYCRAWRGTHSQRGNDMGFEVATRRNVVPDKVETA